MPFQLPTLPSFQTQIPQMPNALDQVSKAATLSGLLSENALRNQLAPLQIQEQQQKLQQQQIATEIQKIQLQDQQALGKYLQSDPNEAVPASKSPLYDSIATYAGIDPADPIMTEIRRMAKYGFSGPGLMAQAKGMLERRNDYNKGTEEQQKIVKDNYDVWKDGIAQLHNADPKDQSIMLAGMLPRFANATHLSPELDTALQHLRQNGVQAIPEVYNLVAAQDKALGLSKAASEASEAASKATKAGALTAAPTENELGNALTGVGAYTIIPMNMRVALQNEMKSAPNKEELQKVEARADTINESFQRSADARQQAMAIKDVAKQQLVAGKLVTEDEKLGSALDQTSGIRSLLDMSKGGNEAATNAALTRFAEHEIVEGGVKRMNQLEYENLATKLGSYGRKFSSWVDSGFKGQMPDATNSEIQTILDAEDAALHKSHDRNVGFVMNRYAGQPLPPEAKTIPTAPKATHRYNPQTGQIEAIP